MVLFPIVPLTCLDRKSSHKMFISGEGGRYVTLSRFPAGERYIKGSISGTAVCQELHRIKLLPNSGQIIVASQCQLQFQMVRVRCRAETVQIRNKNAAISITSIVTV